MKDSVKELRQDISTVETQLNELLDRLIADYPDFSFHLELDGNRYIGKTRRVVIIPTIKINEQPQGHR